MSRLCPTKEIEKNRKYPCEAVSWLSSSVLFPHYSLFTMELNISQEITCMLKSQLHVKKVTFVGKTYANDNPL